MNRVFAISAAMYGNPPRFPITVISGTNKDDIQIEDRFKRDEIFETHSKFKTQDVFRKLFEVIKAVRSESEQSPDVVFGWPHDFPYSMVLNQLQRGDLKPPKKLDTSNPNWSFNNLFAHNLKGVLDVKTLHLREFLEGSKINSVSVLELIQSAELIKTNQFLSALKERLDSGDDSALQELIEFAKSAGYLHGLNSLRTILTADDDYYSDDTRSSRFFLTGPRVNELMTMPYYNFITWHPQIREVFSQRTKEAMCIKHNIALKAPSDEVGRPFIDVAKTYMLDRFDGITN